MSEAACPRCNETIRIPDSPPPADASARCPWCRETYSFQELSGRIPPLVEWIGADGEVIPMVAVSAVAPSSMAAAVAGRYDASADVAEDSFGANTFGGLNSDTATSDTYEEESDSEWSPGIETDDDYGDPVHGTDDLTQGTDAEDDSDEGAEDSFSFADNPSESTEGMVTPSYEATSSVRPRRKSASPVKTMIQMFMGGAVAIPLTGAILFGLQAAGIKTFNFGFWPFDGSGGQPARTAAAPGVVPSAPRPRTPPPENLPPLNPGMEADHFEPRVEETGNEGLETIGGPDSEVVDADGDLAMPSFGGDVEMPEVTMPEVTMPEVTAPSLETADAGEAVPAVEMPAEEVQPPPTEAEMAAGDAKSDELPAPTPAEAAAPGGDLESAIVRARTLSVDLADFSGAGKDRIELLKNFYYSLAEIGEQGNPASSQGYQELFADMRSTNQLSLMARFGSPWVARGDLKHNGLFATGVLEKRDDQIVLVMSPDAGKPVEVPLDGWEESNITVDSWLGKEVVVLAKLEGPAGDRAGTIRYLEASSE